MSHYSFLVLTDFRRIKHNQFFRPALVFTLLLLLLWLLFGDVVCFIDILCLHFAVLKWKFAVLRFQMLILAVTAATIPKQNLRGCHRTDSLAKLRFVTLRWDGMWWVGWWTACLVMWLLSEIINTAGTTSDIITKPSQFTIQNPYNARTDQETDPSAGAQNSLTGFTLLLFPVKLFSRPLLSLLLLLLLLLSSLL